ncbi:Uncharacterised protein [Shigella sonnei]|nr:Uncharacterised protein [Shigella sonnei]
MLWRSFHNRLGLKPHFFFDLSLIAIPTYHQRVLTPLLKVAQRNLMVRYY